MAFGDDRPPMRKVVYSELKPDCQSRYIMLYECGHIHEVQMRRGAPVPKKKICYSCKYPRPKLAQIVLEYRRWGIALDEWDAWLERKRKKEEQARQ